MRAALWIACAATPCFCSVFSCDSMHMPQPLIADAASEASSKSIFSQPGLDSTFMRKPARIVAYSALPTRCVNR